MVVRVVFMTIVLLAVLGSATVLYIQAAKHLGATLKQQKDLSDDHTRSMRALEETVAQMQGKLIIIQQELDTKESLPAEKIKALLDQHGLLEPKKKAPKP